MLETGRIWKNPCDVVAYRAKMRLKKHGMVGRYECRDRKPMRPNKTNVTTKPLDKFAESGIFKIDQVRFFVLEIVINLLLTITVLLSYDHFDSISAAHH
jgi:hypothetical protein